MNFLSWETLIMAPLKSASIPRITGPDRGEKFLVGSSRSKTSAPDSVNESKSSLAFCPPDSSPILLAISSSVNLKEARRLLMSARSSLLPFLAMNSSGVMSGSSRSS